MMKRSLFVLFIVTLVLLSGCDKEKSGAGPCDSESGFFEAVNSKDFENCRGIEDSYCEDYCRFKIAAYSDNPDNCELIQDEEHRGLCYKYLAVDLEDISLCEKAWPSKYICEREYSNKYGLPSN